MLEAQLASTLAIVVVVYDFPARFAVQFIGNVSAIFFNSVAHPFLFETVSCGKA